MEDLILIVGIGVVAAITMFAIALNSVYGGFKASLCEAKPGQVFNFEYMQPLNGDSKRVLAKVLEPVEYRSDAKLEGMNRSSNYRKNDLSSKGLITLLHVKLLMVKLDSSIVSVSKIAASLF